MVYNISMKVGIFTKYACDKIHKIYTNQNILGLKEVTWIFILRFRNDNFINFIQKVMFFIYKIIY